MQVDLALSIRRKCEKSEPIRAARQSWKTTRSSLHQRLHAPCGRLRTIVVTNPAVSEWVSVFEGAKPTTALISTLTQHRNVVAIEIDSYQGCAKSEMEVSAEPF